MSPVCNIPQQQLQLVLGNYRVSQISHFCYEECKSLNCVKYLLVGFKLSRYLILNWILFPFSFFWHPMVTINRQNLINPFYHHPCRSLPTWYVRYLAGGAGLQLYNCSWLSNSSHCSVRLAWEICSSSVVSCIVLTVYIFTIIPLHHHLRLIYACSSLAVVILCFIIP